MKNSVVVIVLLIVSIYKNYAQLHDKHWYMGYNSYLGYDSTQNNFNGISKMEFSLNTPPIITRDSLGINFDRCNITMSDSAGNVLFYTNGVTVRNAQDQIMQNGDSIGWGWYMQYYDPLSLKLGLRPSRAAIVLPTSDKNYYNLFHLFIDSFNQIYIRGKALRWSRINVGESKLNFKDSMIYNHLSSLTVTATKGPEPHSWWLMTQYKLKNCYQRTLIDSTNKVSSEELCVGTFTLPNDGYAASTFTNDGNKFVSVFASNTISGMEVFDFNRCDGTLTPKQSFDLPFLTDSFLTPWGIASSPNSRYLYVFISVGILQFDLQSNNIKNSMIVVARADTFKNLAPGTLYTGQLALDGKIYISTETWYIGVIDKPDIGGVGCSVRKDLIKLPTGIVCLNRYPNYRLGAANCGGVGVKEVAVKVHMALYPNPASSTLQVEYNYINWEQSGSIQLILTDATGRNIHSQALPMYSGLQNIDVSQLAGGVYFVSLSAKGRIVANGRFVKQAP